MRRMFLYSFGFCLLLSALTMVMFLIGRSKPIPDRLTMLHLTDCQIPCWIGITPGITTTAGFEMNELLIKVDKAAVCEKANSIVGRNLL